MCYFPSQGFNLTEDNVMTMRAVFEEVIAGRKQDKVRANEIFKHIVSARVHTLTRYF